MLICNHATIRNYDQNLKNFFMKLESELNPFIRESRNAMKINMVQKVFFFSDIAVAQNYRPIEAYFCEELELKKPTILYGHRIMF